MLTLAAGEVHADEARERQIYSALFEAGLQTSEAAERLYPMSGLVPDDPEGNRRYLERRRAWYEKMKIEARNVVADHFHITPAEAESIQRRGDAESWPVRGQLAPKGDRRETLAGGILMVLMISAAGVVVYLNRYRGWFRVPRPSRPRQPDWRTDPDGYRAWVAKNGR